MRKLTIAVLLPLTGCSVVFGDTPASVGYVFSADRRIMASLGQMHGAISYGYTVTLYGPSTGPREVVRVATLYGARRSGCAYGVDLAWLDANTLAVRYKRAWQVDTVTPVRIDGRSVRVVAQPGRDDSAAPCGAMVPLPLP